MITTLIYKLLFNNQQFRSHHKIIFIPNRTYVNPIRFLICIQRVVSFVGSLVDARQLTNENVPPTAIGLSFYTF